MENYFFSIMNIGYSNAFHVILCKLTTLGCCSIWATIVNMRQFLYLYLENNDGAILECYYIIMSNDFNIHSKMPSNKFLRGKIANNFHITVKLQENEKKYVLHGYLVSVLVHVPPHIILLAWIMKFFV